MACFRTCLDGKHRQTSLKCSHFIPILGSLSTRFASSQLYIESKHHLSSIIACGVWLTAKVGTPDTKL